MKNNFWQKLKISRQKAGQAIYALAPMAGVADSAFRQICKSFGADVVYSEMASATALVYNPEKTLEMLKFDKVERPYVVQLFGSKPEHFEIATKLITKKNHKSKILNYKLPDGIDINFGCPVKKVLKQGAGAALMDKSKLAREIIKSVINNTDLPVSIKIRSRGRETDALTFLDCMSDLDLKAVMIHGRTLKQGFVGPIDVEIIKKARNYFGGVIFANGGINSHNDAVRVLKETRADGLGIARGALGRPWIFKAVHTGQNVERRFRPVKKIALQHAKLAYELKKETGILEMRKHLGWYFAGFAGAKLLRVKLIKTESLKEIRKILSDYELVRP